MLSSAGKTFRKPARGRTERGNARLARRWVSVLALAAVAGLACGGCGEADVSSAKVVVLGVDGMDWSIADPLLAQGKLPNIAALIERGVRADLRSLEPLMKSPTIWTTIATGKGPQKHGISDFVGDESEMPLFNSMGWRARPVWDILSEKGYTVGVVNWMVSWPARPVNGYNVSDRIIYRTEDGFSPIERVTHPLELDEELDRHARPIADVTMDEIAWFFNGDVTSGETTPEIDHAVVTFRDIYGNDETVRSVAEYLLESREQPDFLAVYLNGVDVSSHFFWGPMDPASLDVQMGDELIEACKDVIPRYYQHIDAVLGDIIALLDEGSTIVLCSDHGFRGPFRSRDGIKLGIWMHGPVGVIVAVGPGVRTEGVVDDASVLDVTPTLLTLMGEPVGRDMDGFVLDELISDELLDGGGPRYVDTYEGGGYAAEIEAASQSDAAESALESPVDDEIKERLKSLGYIE